MLFRSEKAVEANKWIDTPPYATKQGVLIQGYDNSISLEWVQSVVSPGADGIYKISGLSGGNGARAVKCYMIIPFPFEDPTGWNITAYEENVKTPKPGKRYIVTVEVLENCRTTYRLATAYYDPKKYSDWAGYDFRDGTRSIIAWRDFPRPKKK